MKNYVLYFMSIFALSPLYGAGTPAYSDMSRKVSTRFQPVGRPARVLYHSHNQSLLTSIIESSGDDTKLLSEALSDPNIKNKINAQDSYTYTPLLLAVFKGYPDTVELLLDCGADPDVMDGQGNTALITATICCDVECVKSLLKDRIGKSKASCILETKGKASPLMAAVLSMNFEIFQLIINNIPGDSLATELGKRKGGKNSTALDIIKNFSTAAATEQARKNMLKIKKLAKAKEAEAIAHKLSAAMVTPGRDLASVKVSSGCAPAGSTSGLAAVVGMSQSTFMAHMPDAISMVDPGAEAKIHADAQAAKECAERAKIALQARIAEEIEAKARQEAEVKLKKEAEQAAAKAKQEADILAKRAKDAARKDRQRKRQEERAQGKAIENDPAANDGATYVTLKAIQSASAAGSADKENIPPNSGSAPAGTPARTLKDTYVNLPVSVASKASSAAPTTFAPAGTVAAHPKVEGKRGLDIEPETSEKKKQKEADDLRSQIKNLGIKIGKAQTFIAGTIKLIKSHNENFSKKDCDVEDIQRKIKAADNMITKKESDIETLQARKVELENQLKNLEE